MGKNKIKFSPLVIILFVILLVYVATLLVALGWAVLSSFKDAFEFDVNPVGLPNKWVFNHQIAFEKFYVEIDREYAPEVYMPEMLLNSIEYALGCAIMSTITPCIVAYLCAKFKYRFSSIITSIVIIVMVTPIIGSQPAEIQMARTLGIYDTIWGMWIMKMTFLGMYYLVFLAIFRSMPDAYIEAAKIDGANNVQILFKIILPYAMSTIFTVLLILFINFWNDYSVPMIYIPSYPTLAQGMWEFSLSRDNELSSVPMKMAGATILLAPVLVLFLAFHKKLMGNLQVGGIKG